MRLALVTGMREAVEGFTAVAQLVEWRNHHTAVFAIPRMDYAKRMARIWTLTVEEIIRDRIYVRVGRSYHCWCGQPLHYELVEPEQTMIDVCRQEGEYATIDVPQGSFLVPRHYIALHGLDYGKLHTYGFERKSYRLGDIKHGPRRPYVPSDCGTF